MCERQRERTCVCVCEREKERERPAFGQTTESVSVGGKGRVEGQGARAGKGRVDGQGVRGWFGVGKEREGFGTPSVLKGK